MKRKRSPYAVSVKARKKLLQDYQHRQMDVVAGAINWTVDLHLDSQEPEFYRIVEAGKVIARWRESDHPGFAAWLIQRLHERKQALRIAREAGETFYSQVEGGRKGGESNDPEEARPFLANLIRKALARGEDPRTYCAEWKGDIPDSTFYDLIKRIEEKAAK